MKTELIPAVTAAVGGSALLGGIVVAEVQQARRMRASRLPFVLTFPLATDTATAKRALVALSGLSAANEILAEVSGRDEGITHRLYLPQAVAAATCAQLRAAIPGLRIEEAQPEPVKPRPTLTLAVSVPKRLILRGEDPVGASRALLAALLPLGRAEELSIQWALRPGRPTSPTEEPDKAWEAKTNGPGLFVSGVALVQADGRPRARALAARLTAVFRAQRGSGGSLDISRGGRQIPRASRQSGWLNVDELVCLIGWPIGTDAIAGVQLGAARQIAPVRKLARNGRPLLVAHHDGKSRPVALSAEAAYRHAYVTGSTGSGKSAVLARGILADIASGYGGVVIDPKAQLVADVLDRVAPEHAGRVAVIDPSDPVIPGVDLFAGGDPDLRADVLLTVLRSTIFRDSWGPRLDAYARLGFRSLAEMPGAALADWPRLFMDPAFRRQAVGRLRDPLLAGQWAMYESLSEAEKVQHVAPALSRIVSLLGRPVVRAVLGGQGSRLDIGKLLAERRWLLVSLPVGVIGAPAARLIASCLSYVVWSAIAARAAIPSERRHHLSLYFDELQSLTDQGIGIEELLEQARGYGASVTVATQAAGRLPDVIRTSLLANVGTLMTFRAGADEATRLARELPGLDARDLQSLGEFEVAARVAVGRGSASAVVTGQTEALPPVVGSASLIRQRSAERYGPVPVEASSPSQVNADVEIGRLRRQS